jgi:Protein of unknown function (DUF642)
MNKMIQTKLALRKLAIIGFSAITLSTFGSSAQAVNLVTNGDFESFTGGSAFQSNSAGSLPSQLNNAGTNGYTKLTGWTTGNGILAFLMNPTTDDTTGSRDIQFSDNFKLWGPGNGSNNGLTSSPNGGLYVALDGALSYRSTGISQTLTGLIAGQSYDVNFSWAGAQQNGYDGATTEQVQVKFGSGPAQTTTLFNNPNHGFSGWKQQKFTFTADAGNNVLNFLAIGNPNGVPPFVLLDGVSVDATPVPDPGMGIGMALVGVGLLRARFARKSQKQAS